METWLIHIGCWDCGKVVPGISFVLKYQEAERAVWRVDYGKPMRTGHKQGEMRLTCFSESGTALETEQLFLLSCLSSAKEEHRFLLLQCYAPPQEPLLHHVYHWV
jgi:hypothetical protein